MTHRRDIMSDENTDNKYDIIIKGLQIAAEKAKAEHKRNNQPIVVSIDGKVKRIPPEDISISSND